MPKMIYVLFIKVNKDTELYIGSLGKILFKKGYYFYVGSAKKGLKQRIKRHLTENKRVFWHIDYLLASNESKIKDIRIGSRLAECETSKLLDDRGYGFINNFGSSDCRCRSHLFFKKGNINVVKYFLKKRGFKNADKSFF